MKFLFVIAHADKTGRSSSHRLAAAARDGVTAAGHEVRVVDLVHTDFLRCASPDDFADVTGTDEFSYADLQARGKPSAAIKEQQEHLTWCTHLIVFGPLWFYKFPAIFYAWTGRVWTMGWAYDCSKPREELALFGRKALLVVTTGAPSEYYSHGGLTSLDGLFYTTTFSMHLCGLSVYRSQGIWNPKAAPPSEFAETEAKIVGVLLGIDSRAVLPFSDPSRAKGVDEIEVFTQLPNVELNGTG